MQITFLVIAACSETRRPRAVGGGSLMGKLNDKVAMITGGARGQGRAMAIKFASEGADIVIVDACAPMETVPYELSSEEDLQDTRERVEALGRTCIARVGDVRSLDDMRATVTSALDEFGHVDILCA